MNRSDFIPPILSRALSRYNFLRSYGWFGNYASWEDALKHSKGYDSATIIEKVKNATLKVNSGEAVYERDSVLYDHVEYSWPLLAALLWVAAQKEGKLNVLDFGGSLGSTYFQNKKFYQGLKSVKWSVVEQEHFVENGKKFFENQELKFYKSMEECMREEQPPVVLFSCVLQYLEKPYEVIKKALQLKPEFIVVDNMPFQQEGSNRITVQKVHPDIYEASYPCWFLNKEEFLNVFKTEYTLVADFKSDLFIRVDGNIIPYEGFIFTKA